MKIRVIKTKFWEDGFDQEARHFDKHDNNLMGKIDQLIAEMLQDKQQGYDATIRIDLIEKW